MRNRPEYEGRSAAEKTFLAYAGRYESDDGRVALKILHTLKVADVMQYLTTALALPERLSDLAHLCAVFHDIGRFEQLKRYHTFLDFKSLDHAALSCEILKRENLLADLSREERRMVLTAIDNHNRLEIEEGLDRDTLLLCKLLRDADKCDIFRVFACEDMKDTMGETVEQVAGEKISDVMFDSIRQRKCVRKEERKTGLDIWVSFLAFFFDMNFNESIVLLREKKYYRQPFDRTVFTDPETAERVKVILREIENYLDGRLQKETGARQEP